MDDWLKSHATMVMIQNSFEYLYDFSAVTIRKSGKLSTLSYALKEGIDLLEASGSEILPNGQQFLFQHPALAKLFTHSIIVHQSVEWFKEISKRFMN
ncbi:MAG: hypothetical protein ACTJG1_08660 [Enterococcus gilvus]